MNTYSLVVALKRYESWRSAPPPPRPIGPYQDILALSLLGTLLTCILLLAGAATAGEFYLTGGVGQTRFEPTVPDGTWYQEAFPYQFTKQDLGWQIGAGYALTEAWAVEIKYLDFGTARLHGRWTTSDANYNPIIHQPTGAYMSWMGTGQDRVHGVSLAVRRAWQIGGVDPFLLAGGIIGHHHIQVEVSDLRDQHGQALPMPSGDHSASFSGMLYGGVVGGGVCYQHICGQVEYYKILSHAGFPISTSIVMPTLIVRVPLF
jgi:hypothetical protein